MNVLGQTLLGGLWRRGEGGDVYPVAAATGERLGPAFGSSTLEDVDVACRMADAAFDAFRALPDEQRARFLEAIADGLIALGSVLIERAHLESGLSKARLEGERQRTVLQLRMFSELLRSGRWHGAVIDPAQPQRRPQARADLRLRRIAIGPVAVFGASNFPLAFSVAGGDSAAALAAGCPVVVKAHPAHLGTSELAARVVQQAASATAMPEGVFSMLVDADTRVGQALVSHHAIQAVGFTGSRRGGLALLAAAAARPVPIPVYAEMSSVNPVLLLPDALAARAQSLAEAFVESLVLGAGQFCTNPGMVLALAGAPLQAFVSALAPRLAGQAAATMLTPGIHAAYRRGVDALRAAPGVALVAEAEPGRGPYQASPACFRVDSDTFLQQPGLWQENFGPSALLVACKDIDDLLSVVRGLEGQLTLTLHADAGDHALAASMLPLIERKAGRIVFNAFPTGVEVAPAMVHGGPFPATSDTRSTSVGAAAIERFLRPVCYQDVPDVLLPAVLQQRNPLNTWRLIDGALARA